MKVDKDRQRLYITGGLLVLVIVVAAIARKWEFLGYRSYDIMFAFVAITTFIGMLGYKQDLRSNDRGMRKAIAASIVITYLTIVAHVVFLVGGPEDLPEITKQVLGHFTTIVGVVIAFY